MPAIAPSSPRIWAISYLSSIRDNSAVRAQLSIGEAPQLDGNLTQPHHQAGSLLDGNPGSVLSGNRQARERRATRAHGLRSSSRPIGPRLASSPVLSTARSVLDDRRRAYRPLALTPRYTSSGDASATLCECRPVVLPLSLASNPLTRLSFLQVRPARSPLLPPGHGLHAADRSGS